MKLYYMIGACSLASHIALYESGIDFETAALDRKTRKTSDGQDFDQINSKGYVPALRLDDGQLLTENVAVLLYIDDRWQCGNELQIELRDAVSRSVFRHMIEMLQHALHNQLLYRG